MIGHNNIACYIHLVLMQMIKPLINQVVCICLLKQLQPLKTCECDEVKGIGVLIVMEADRYLNLIK